MNPGFSRPPVVFFLSLLTMLVLPSAPAQVPQPAPESHKETQQARLPEVVRKKLSSDLQAAALKAAFSIGSGPSAAAGSEQDILISVLLDADAPSPGLLQGRAQSRAVAGVRWETGRVRAANLAKLATSPGVRTVVSTETFAPAIAPSPDPDSPVSELQNLRQQPNLRAIWKQGGKAKVRDYIDSLRAAAAASHLTPSPAYAAPLSTKQAAPPSTRHPSTTKAIDVLGAHQAWEKGYKGKGIVIAIVDTGVDFAHPDLDGAQARIPIGPYAGWPFAYDALSGYYYTANPNDTIGPDTYWDKPDSWYAHTLEVDGITRENGICRARLRIDYGSESGWTHEPVDLDFQWPDRSISGRYFYTVHPDPALLSAAARLRLGYAYANNAPAAVIVADESTSGTYDTVYVDVNCNQDFADDKPLRRGSETAGADVQNAQGGSGADGVWDISAGMLCWIADGVNPPPGVAAVYPGQAAIPAAGRLICFVGDKDGHGSGCASVAAARGVISDPNATGPSNTLFAGGSNVGGAGGAVLAGMAPEAKIAAFQNGSSLIFDSWTLAAIGLDGVANSGDEAQVISNSWGDSRTIADGWDEVSRFANNLNRAEAQNSTILVASGNGGPGYGTQIAPGGGTILSVGASTSIGSTMNFERVLPSQHSWGSVIPFSGRGPGTLGDMSPDVLAVGAWGTAATPLNRSTRNGQGAYVAFSGTSMACPMAAGAMALTYQAFSEANGHLPAYNEARSLLLGGALDFGYDVLTQGSGQVNAGQSTALAAGETWLVNPPQWMAGNYRGKTYPAFSALMHRGETATARFAVLNPSAAAASIHISDCEWILAHERYLEFDLPYVVGIAGKPNWLLDISADVEAYDPDFIRIVASFGFSTFDLDGNYSEDNRWGVLFADWTDHNGNGSLWTDANGNGQVEPGEIDVDAQTQISEYNRMTYGYNSAPVIEATVGRRALQMRHNGVFAGLQRISGNRNVHFKVRILYYKKTDWTWASAAPSEIAVEPGNTEEFLAQITIPADAPYGVHQGAIVVSDAAGQRAQIIPVVACVAPNDLPFDFGSDTISVGIARLRARDFQTPSPIHPYENGLFSGVFNWAWRYEAGDWRFFYFDLPANALPTGAALITDTQWASAPTDIDTWIAGPVADSYSAAFPEFFGPSGAEVVGGSANAYRSAGIFGFSTSTGGAREIAGAPLESGLHFLALHQVLSAGLETHEAMSGSAWRIQTMPYPVRLEGFSGRWTQLLSSEKALEEGAAIEAYGFSRPQESVEQVRQDDPNNACTASWVRALDLDHCGLLEIDCASTTAMDIDLFLYRDGGNGVWDCKSGDDAQIASSTTPSAEEHIVLSKPADGRYWIAMHGYRVPSPPQDFRIRIRAVQGSDMQILAPPSGSVTTSAPVEFQLQWSKAVEGDDWEGILWMGPASTPMAMQVPVLLRARPITPRNGWAVY